jgi:hypothetical protein
MLNIDMDIKRGVFVLVKQENVEGRQPHNAYAERFSTLAEIRREIVKKEYVARHTTREEWLKGSFYVQN